MTSITLFVTGASIRAEVNGVLTSGMVGIPVSIRYDEAWSGLTKNLVCRCSRLGPARGDTRTILNVGETAEVAHEIMRSENTLYLGVEGYNADGSLVMPTAWANCGYIRPGANAGADISAVPMLPVWAQIPGMIGTLSNLNTEARENLVEAINEVLGKAGTGGGNVDLSGYVKSVNGKSPDKNGNVEVADSGGIAGGLTGREKNLILTLFRNAAYTSAGMGDTLTQLETLWSGSGEPNNPDIPVDPDEPEKTLTSISATYSGGDAAVGTAVSDLTGIVVTAHYSDGTSETVTGYTLSGTIAEGENTITVSYGGKTTTITVAGVASGEVEPTDNRYTYTIDNPDTLCDSSGGLVGNGQYDTTGYIDVAENTVYMTIAVNVPISESKTVVHTHAQFFNGDEFISKPDGQITVQIGDTKAVKRYTIPSGATKFRVTVQNSASKFLLYKGDVSVDNVEF